MNKLIDKIEPLNKILESKFDLRLNTKSIDHLLDIEENYNHKRAELLRIHGEIAREKPEYIKAFLISEAATLLLREIAPKRRKRKRGKK